MPRPFMRSNSTTWYAKLEGKQIPLGKDPRFKTPPKVKPKEPPPEILKKYHACNRSHPGQE
jgi:hypothetical protein